MTAWLAEEGAVPGWRQAAFHQMASSALGKTAEDAVKLMVEDSGLKGGPLYDTWEQRAKLWDAYAESLRGELAKDIAARMVDTPHREVGVLVPDSGGRSGATVGTFASQLWPGEQRDESAELWPTPLDYSVHASCDGRRGNEVRQNPDMCAMSVRIQLRRLIDADWSESADEGKPDWDVDDDGVWG
ncbi:hypothetical protein ACQ86B_29055 (plasmid) [Mycolicibacterium aichiense]|uniref:hypothetical protein n=1 Tax=Mycolicibacterium aichiense TaxID=1799 RepID=UPI003D66BF47